MAELAEKTEVVVPMDHNLECPACHTRLDIVVIASFGRGAAHVVGGSNFSSDISVSLTPIGKRMLINEHVCELPSND